MTERKLERKESEERRRNVVIRGIKMREGKRKEAVEEVLGMGEGGVLLVVSLDIVNAFNTLPWPEIRGAMVYQEFPSYLRRIVGDYLRDRRLKYWERDGRERGRGVYCEVPQGSVLGPLWGMIGSFRMPSLGCRAVC